MWKRAADPIDAAIERLLQRKLNATFMTDVWETTIISFREQFVAERKRKMAQLSILEKVMENLIASLDTLKNHDMILAVERRYEEAKLEHSRLTAELVAFDGEQQKIQQLAALKDTCGPALAQWSSLTRDEKRILLDVFVDHIEAIPRQRYELQLIIYW
jgi:hypothetical protein